MWGPGFPQSSSPPVPRHTLDRHIQIFSHISSPDAKPPVFPQRLQDCVGGGMELARFSLLPAPHSARETLQNPPDMMDLWD